MEILNDETNNLSNQACLLCIDLYTEYKLLKLLNDTTQRRKLEISILTFPRNEVIYIASLINGMPRETELLLERLGKFKLSKEEIELLLSANCTTIRIFAIHIASYKQILKIALIEDDYLVAIEIVDKLKESKKISSKDADFLLKAKSDRIREFAISYAKKQSIIYQCFTEKHAMVVNYLLNYLSDKKISRCTADFLINAASFSVRRFAAFHASKNSLLLRAKVELDNDVLTAIINSLSLKSITKAEANIMLNAASPIVRNFATAHASTQALINRANIEDDECVINAIFDKLQKTKITSNIANSLINVNSASKRTFITKFASKNALIKRAAIEDNEEVINAIILRLERFEITNYEADNYLVEAISERIKVFGVNYCSHQMLIKLALSQSSYSICSKISEKLKSLTISSSEANEILLHSSSYKIRTLAARSADIKALIECSKKETYKEVIIEIIKRLKFLGITTEFADELVLSSNSNLIRIFALEKASKKAVNAIAIIEEDSEVVKELIKKLSVFSISQEDLQKFLFAHSFDIVKFAINYLGDEKTSEFLKMTL